MDHVILTGGNCTAQGPCWYEDVCPTEKASGAHAVVYCVDARNVTLTPELSHTMQSKPNGGLSLNCTPNVLYKLEGTRQ